MSQLYLSQVLFPPQVFLVFWAHCWHHVVEIHNHMDQIVHQIWKCAVAACKKEQINLILIFCGIWNKPAINLTQIQVSKGVSEWWYRWSKLIWLSFFRITKKIYRKKIICRMGYENLPAYCVSEFGKFWYVVPPAKICHLKKNHCD